MLTALKEDLKRLAADPADPFHTHIRRRIGKRATGILEKRIKQLIFLMPGLISSMRNHWETEDCPQKVKKLGGFLFAYLYHPKDFIPEDEYGLFGYLDDAYLTAVVYEKAFADAALPTIDQQDFLERISSIKKYVRALIPFEAAEIEKMVEDAVCYENYENFASVFKGAA